MKTTLLILFLVCFHTISFSQISFEPSYFVKNDGTKVNCFIKNRDWKNNPKSFSYKLSEKDFEQNIGINEVTMFEISNKLKYERHVVEIDYSTDNINNLTENPLPEFIKDTLFLKVLIQGKATLYYFEKGNIFRFFYSLGDSNITQLI